MEQEEGEKSFKFGIGSVTDVVHRHSELKLSNKKEERYARMREKRMPIITQEKSNDEKIENLIASFPIERFLSTDEPADILNTLKNILRMDRADMYYAPSTMFPEYKGPYLFQNEHVVAKLCFMLAKSENVQLVRTLTHIFICLSYHPEIYTWTSKMMHGNVVESALRLLSKCPDAETHENCFWLLGNMAMDHGDIRDYIMKYLEPLIQMIRDKYYKKHRSVCDFFFLSLFAHNPIPQYSQISVLWDGIMSNLPGDDETLLRLLYGIARQTNANQYREIICNNKKIFEYLKHNAAHQLLCAKILCCLTISPSIHIKLLEEGIVQLFVELLDNRDPIFREEAIAGLATLAASRYATNILCDDRCLKVVEKHFLYSQIGGIQVQLKLFLCNLVVCFSSEQLSIAFDRNWLQHFSSMILEQHDTNVIQGSLKAIKKLLLSSKQNVKIIRDTLEEHCCLDRLESLAQKYDDADDICEIFDKLPSDMDIE